MLRDEEIFNEAIELCPQDYGLVREDLRFRLQIELALGQLQQASDEEERTSVTLERALDMMCAELMQKWALAWSIGDIELRTLLASEIPQSCEGEVAHY